MTDRLTTLYHDVYALIWEVQLYIDRCRSVVFTNPGPTRFQDGFNLQCLNGFRANLVDIVENIVLGNPSYIRPQSQYTIGVLENRFKVADSMMERFRSKAK